MPLISRIDIVLAGFLAGILMSGCHATPAQAPEKAVAEPAAQAPVPQPPVQVSCTCEEGGVALPPLKLTLPMGVSCQTSAVANGQTVRMSCKVTPAGNRPGRWMLDLKVTWQGTGKERTLSDRLLMTPGEPVLVGGENHWKVMVRMDP